VTAHDDLAKSAMLESLSLHLAEHWWVRELVPTPMPNAAGASLPRRVEGPGFGGILAAAPPVYDPGGPVFQAQRLADDADAALLERSAAAAGAVLVVVPADPESARAAGLRARGWTIASAWYVGWPALS